MDGFKEVVWELNDCVYVLLFLIKDGYFYGVFDVGIVVCWKSDMGELKWKVCLSGGFSVFLVFVGDLIYLINE